MHTPSIRPPRKDTLVCAALCFACALLSLGIFMLQDGGAFTIREDFDFQQIPFTMALHKQIERGGLAGWCWNLDLGTSAIQGFGFYELGSPFFWTSMLFPADAFPYVVGWLYILKYVVAGVTAHLFLRRFASSSRAATVGALLYAFSGFQTANLLFYHFHDVVALFPLLLIGLERLMANNRDWACFVLAACINALVNYFFFVQDVIFLLLYFGFRFGPSLWRDGPRKLCAALGLCLGTGVLGTAMAAPLLVPSLVYMLGNPRTGSSAIALNNLIWEPRQALFQLQGLLLPADAMFDHNAIIAQQWTSTSCWLPVVGPSLCIAYLRERLGKHDWLARLLVTLLVVCASPLLTSGFILFTGIYQRWWYLLVLMGALASTMVLDKPREFDVCFGTAAYAALLVAFVATVVACAQFVDSSYLLHPAGFALYAGVAASGCAATYLLAGRRTAHSQPAVTATTPLVTTVALFAVATTAITLHAYRQDPYRGEMLEHIRPDDWRDTLAQIELGTQLDPGEPQYRYDTCDNRLTLTGSALGTASFNSTIANSIGRFEEFFDWGSWNVWNLAKESIPGLNELVAGRYKVVSNPGNARNAPVVARYDTRDGTAYVTERQACPMGFVCDTYAITDEVYGLDKSKRAVALLQAPVVSPADEQAVTHHARRVSPADLDLSAPVDELVARAASHTVQDFWRNDHGYGFKVALRSPALVYLSIPHDVGWSAFVDGKPATAIDSAGMTLLPLDAGAHEVRFSYQTPGLQAGLVAGGIAWATFVVLLLWRARSNVPAPNL